MNIVDPIHSLNKSDLGAFSRFIELLSAANLRVSSKKVTSKSVICGAIDKLALTLAEPIVVNDLVQMCRFRDLKLEGKYLRDKKLYLVVSTRRGSFYFLQGHPSNEIVTKLHCNPSSYACFEDLESDLKVLVGDKLGISKISRIDFCVDILQPYSEVIKGLDIENKSLRSVFHNGRKDSGLLIGSRDDKYNIYDKRLESDLDHDLTRIERQLSGKKVLFNNFDSLRNGLNLIEAFKPLGSVKLFKVVFDNFTHESEAINKKRMELEHLISFDGFYVARKKLNENRNFQRDYGCFFSKIDCPVQPEEALKASLMSFFKSRSSENVL